MADELLLPPAIKTPTPEDQAVYDESHKRALERRNKFYSASPGQEANPSKLSETGKAYREKMARINAEPTQLDGILGRLEQTVRHSPRRQSLSFEIAIQVVNRIYELELIRKNKAFVLTDEQQELLHNITRHFIGDPTSPFPAHKGLFVYGGYGVGKTFMFRAMRTLCQVAPIPEMDFNIVSTKSLVQEVIDHKEAKDKKANPMLAYSRGNLLLDDLGEEKKAVMSYGNEENPMDILLSERNIAFDRFGQQTHVTSNMGVGEEENALIGQIEKKYGSRILDRFYDLFEFVLLPGESKRG